MNVAMILAGGVGSRVGDERPKQFIEIKGKPIIAYTIEIYQNNPIIDAICIVCHKDWIGYMTEIEEKLQLSKIKWIIEGGDTFQKSVINGIVYLKDRIVLNDIIMIHYAASPFTSRDIIDDAIDVCKRYGSSVSCIPCYQLMGTNDEAGTSRHWVNRDNYIQIACPQTFRFGYLLDIYSRAEQKGLLEKCEPHTTSLMYELGDTIFQSKGNQANIKITTKADVDFFRRYIRD